MGNNASELEVGSIADLIPHRDAMCLLEEVLQWDDASIRLRTRSHQSLNNPLRRAGRLDPIHLCEYGAQAMAVHGGLLARREGGRASPGFLVSLRDIQLAAGDAALIEDALVVTATRIHGDQSGWQYAFEVTDSDRAIASGRATVAMAR